MPGKQHEVWFYEKFATGNFQVDRAEDWAGLQVMDGNTRKPAMGQGFQGRPSSEQIENLYNLLILRIGTFRRSGLAPLLPSVFLHPSPAW